MLLLCALVAGSGSVWATPTELISWSRSGTTNTSTSGYTFNTNATSKTGYYQDQGTAGTTVNYIMLYHSSTKLFSSTPSTITFTANLGGGSAKDPLDNNAYVCFVDKDGNDIAGSSATVTTKITSQGGDAFDVSMSTAKAGDAYGVKIYHTKESSWNMRYYSFSLSYEASSDPSSNASFAESTPEITFPATKTYSQEATTASGYTGTVVYEMTENTAGATLSGATVTVTQAGTVTVLATAPAITGFAKSTASYTLTVTDSRTAADLDYAEATQTINVGEILSSATLTNPHSLSVSYESSDEDIATVDASGNVTGIKIGSTTITATFDGNDDYLPGSASYTINVTRAKLLGELIYESVSGYTSTSDGTGELSTSSTNLDYNSWNSFSKVYAGANGHLKFGSSSAIGKAVTKSIAMKGNGVLTYKVMRFNDGNNGELKISVTGATATGDVDVTGTADWVEKTVNLTGATGNVVITFESTADGKRIRVDDISLVQTHVAATISSAAKYATFSSAYATDFSATGITVYTATDNETYVTLNEVAAGKVPANTPVVLYKAGADGTAIDVPVIASAADLGDNDLRVSTGTDVENMYVLAMNPTIGFYPWAGTTDLSAGKVYLQGKASYSAREFIGFDFGFGGETTGVNDVRGKMADVRGDFFDLQGRKVANPKKGLYIVNGKKVAIK